MRKFLYIIMCLLWLESTWSRTIIIGFDGMDPQLLQQWMDSGELPHFKKMAEKGHFQPLATTNPAQSPVAWSSFATGLNPGQHGVFDFVHRDPETLSPIYSISGIKGPKTTDIMGWQVPTSGPVIYNKRLGKPFWLTAEQSGHHSSVLRVPVTYPPDKNSRMLSGMGVPDLLGTQGTYTFYATKYINPSEVGGQVVRVKVNNHRIETTLAGPPHPFTGVNMKLPLSIEKNDQKSVAIDLNGESIMLKQGQWSDWVMADFSYAGLLSLSGMVRMYLVEAFPRVKLYVSPVNVNPKSPDLPIAQPASFAQQLSQDIGLYHTLGMPEETWSLNDGLIDSSTYLDMVKTILAEREAMFFSELEKSDSELVVSVFVQTDRVSHMFWRGLDPNHPQYTNTNELERGAIKWIYQEADRILSKTLDKLQANDRLMVISDHGFAPYYRHVHINRWLQKNGYLALQKDKNSEDFDLNDIDWDNTRAYAMGLNGIFINVKGREKHGMVDESDRTQLLKKIKSDLLSLRDNQQPVINRIDSSDEIYDAENRKHSPDLIIGYHKGYRASWQTVLGEAPAVVFSDNNDKWSGDHCIDPHLVPGILLTNFSLDDISNQPLSIANMGDVALSTLDEKPQHVEHLNGGYLNGLVSLIQSMLNALMDHLPMSIGALLVGLICALCIMMIIWLSNRFIKPTVLKWSVKFFLVLIMALAYLYASSSAFNYNTRHSKEWLIQAHAIDGVNLPALNWYNKQNHLTTKNLTLLARNKWRYRVSNEEITLKESDGYVLFKPSNFVGNKSQQRWWYLLFSDSQSHISPYSQVQKITVTSIQRPLIHMWLWFFCGVILSLIAYLLIIKYFKRIF